VGSKETEAVTFLEKKVKAMPAEGAGYEEVCTAAISALQVWRSAGAVARAAMAGCQLVLGSGCGAAPIPPSLPLRWHPCDTRPSRGCKSLYFLSTPRCRSLP
jgi:hypothetical protein